MHAAVILLLVMLLILFLSSASVDHSILSFNRQKFSFRVDHSLMPCRVLVLGAILFSSNVCEESPNLRLVGLVTDPKVRPYSEIMKLLIALCHDN